ncbi:MAG: DUF1398 domain-containing protein [Stellaceae bacterium]
MDNDLIAAFHDASAGSINGTMDFPQVVGKLMAVGVESYHCDLYRRERTFYMPDGGSHVEEESELDPAEFNGARVAHDFSENGIKAALKAIQANEISYLEFLRRIMKAGCVGYLACFAGKRVVYLGRQGDAYIEWFPGAK